MKDIVSNTVIKINDLKWNKSELEEIADTSNDTYIRLKKKDVSRIPLLDFKIYFNDDIWDFSKANILLLPSKHFIYDFSDIHYAYKNYVKRLILQYILNRISYTSISKKFRLLKVVSVYLIKKHIFEPQYITASIVNSFCEELLNRNINEEYRKDHKRQFKDLLKNIEYYNSDIKYIDHYEILDQTDYDLIEAEREDGKTPNIPGDIFNLIISCCISDIKSIETSFREKMAACILLILSQVGMRIGELRLLEANKKQEITLFNGDKASKLEFKSYKTVRSKEFIWTKSFMTEHCILAYETLEKITALKRKECNTNYLISGFRGEGTPYDISTIRGLILNFMVKHYKDIPCVNRRPEEVDGFLKVEICHTSTGDSHFIKKEYKIGLKDEDIIYAPNPHQFRVAVCNELIKANVDLEWIREHMNHLTADMTLHYKRKIEEERNAEFSEKVIKGIVLKQFRPIGKEAEALVQRIEEFLAENNYNVERDLETIIEKLKGKVPIRQKKEGYCVKSAFGRKCQYNEVLCAFGLCPNHIVDYQCVDITYKRFCDGVKTIQYNQKNEYLKEAEMETNKLKRTINECLIPEIEELKYEINRQGMDNIKDKNSNLIDIIDNISMIEKEVSKWIS